MDEYSTSMTDEAFDREVDRLLNVQPSRNFVARVRARIDREPIRARWFGVREMATAGAAVVIVIVGIWMAQSGPGHIDDQPVANVNAEGIPPMKEERGARLSAGTPIPSRSAATSPTAPSVLISPDDAIGLRHLVSALRDGALDPQVLPTVAGEAEPPMPIVIEPMTVEPLLSASEIQIGELQ
jgi:hypothetical protein